MLGFVPEPTDLTVLAHAANDSDERIRTAVVDTLGSHGKNPTAVDLPMSLLDDPSTPVRVSAVQLCGCRDVAAGGVRNAAGRRAGTLVAPQPRAPVLLYDPLVCRPGGAGVGRCHRGCLLPADSPITVVVDDTLFKRSGRRYSASRGTTTVRRRALTLQPHSLRHRRSGRVQDSYAVTVRQQMAAIAALDDVANQLVSDPESRQHVIPGMQCTPLDLR
jgi:hypothetical protein